jgi:hypothetical protein
VAYRSVKMDKFVFLVNLNSASAVTPLGLLHMSLFLSWSSYKPSDDDSSGPVILSLIALRS